MTHIVIIVIIINNKNNYLRLLFMKGMQPEEELHTTESLIECGTEREAGEKGGTETNINNYLRNNVNNYLIKDSRAALHISEHREREWRRVKTVH